MKQKLIKALSCLLVLVLTVSSLPLQARADVLKDKDILKVFSDTGKARYNETGFLMTAEEMALMAANILADQGIGVSVLHDDTKSTASNQKYILMYQDEKGKDNALVGVSISMDVNKKGEVLGAAFSMNPAKWNASQLKAVLPAWLAIYEALHGSMTDDMRQDFLCEDNLLKTDAGYRTIGSFDGLYYECKFTDSMYSFIIKPIQYSDYSAAGDFKENYEICSGKGYAIHTGKLTRHGVGDFTVEVELSNKSKNPLLFDLRSAYMCGHHMSLPLYAEVAPGHTKVEKLRIDTNLLAAIGVDSLYDVVLNFRITDTKTREVLFNDMGYFHIDLPFQAENTFHRKDVFLFENGDLYFAIVGSGLNNSGAPQLYLQLHNDLGEEVMLRAKGNCLVGKREYDLFATGNALKYGMGMMTVQPAIYDLKGNTTVEFDIALCSYNYNDMILCSIRVTFDETGKIVDFKSRAEESFNYKNIVDQEY